MLAEQTSSTFLQLSLSPCFHFSFWFLSRDLCHTSVNNGQLCSKKGPPLQCTNAWGSISHFQCNSKANMLKYQHKYLKWFLWVLLPLWEFPCTSSHAICSSWDEAQQIPQKCKSQLLYLATLAFIGGTRSLHSALLEPQQVGPRGSLYSEVQESCINPLNGHVWQPCLPSCEQRASRLVPKPNDVLPTSTPETRPFRAERQAELA